jgi:thiamine kinase-like enzyme
MSEINLPLFSKLVSEKLGQKVNFTNIEKIGSGYHSDGFKVTAEDGRSFFLKYVRSHDLGFEFPERQIMSLMVSNSMGQRASNDPASVGVVVLNRNEELILPDITDSTKVYHLQEFGGTGTSYSAILEKNINKKSVDEEDKKQLSAIADFLLKVHSVKHHSKNKAQLDAVYNDGLRNVLTNPELSIMVLSEFPADYKILDLEGQKEIISLMYENIKYWTNRSDRLTALHGDFWGANIFFKEDGNIFVIDFSRIPWGDPGIDVGWFIAQFLWNYHSTGNNYFKELTEAWLNIYEEKSGDKEIRKAIALVVGWTGIVQIYPRWFPGLDEKMGKKFIGHIKNILKNKEFTWKE